VPHCLHTYLSMLRGILSLALCAVLLALVIQDRASSGLSEAISLDRAQSRSTLSCASFLAPAEGGLRFKAAFSSFSWLTQSP
jgi:hypothetical protein